MTDDITVTVEDSHPRYTDEEVEAVVRDNGSTRPSSPEIGQQFFDTNLGHPIWYNGTDWVDATGAVV